MTDSCTTHSRYVVLKWPAMSALSQLKPKERAFVAALMDDPSASGAKAAQIAGWAKSGASVAANRALKKPQVQAALEEYKERMQAVSVVNSTWVLRELVEGAMLRISDIINPEDGTVLPVDQWPQRADRMCSSIKVEELFDGTGKE